MKLPICLLFIIAWTGVATGQDLAPLQFGDGIDDVSLLAELQNGRLAIVFRHGQTTPLVKRNPVSGEETLAGSDQEKSEGYYNCDLQRNLDNEGRQMLRQTANAIRQTGIYVSEVFASPMCRTRESAWILFGKVTPSDALIGDPTAERNKLVASLPDDGGIRVLVTHSYVIRDLIATPSQPIRREDMPMGTGFVIRPDRDGGYEVLARLTTDDWNRLATLAQKQAE